MNSRSHRCSHLVRKLWVLGILTWASAISAAPIRLDVHTFHAQGDGQTDDTAAIQAAIAAAHAAPEGGVVFFPKGVYLLRINPRTGRALRAQARVTLQGAGRDQTILRLADQQGRYEAIIQGDSVDTSGFSLLDLTLDSNASHSPPTSLAAIMAPGNARMSLYVVNGSHFEVARCRFTDIDDINTISFNGLVSDIQISNNIFDQIGGAFDHDSSIVYIHGPYVHIVGNTFRGRKPGAPGARTAIETHGSNTEVRDNTVTDLNTGLNVSGVAIASDHVVVESNTITGCMDGIIIWSFFWGPNRTNPALTDVEIADNRITCDPNAWQQGGIVENRPNGIMLSSASDSPIQNLRIERNTIRFTPLSRSGQATDNTSNGISFSSSLHPRLAVSDITIAHNIIENAPAAGIRLDINCTRCQIVDNTITDPGQSSGPFADNYRSAIIVAGDLQSVEVKDNSLIDDQPQATMKYGINAIPTSAANCKASGNHVRVASGAPVPLFSAGNAAARTIERNQK